MADESDNEIAPIQAEPVAVRPPSEAVLDGDEPLVAERIIDAPLTVNDIVDGAQRALDGASTQVRRLVDRGRYRKLRITRKGKPVLPDIPLAAVAAVEAASLAGAGVARVLAVNVVGRLLFDVEVVNEADRFLDTGRQALLDGDLDTAKIALEKAVRIDDTHAEAFMQLGVLNRLRGEFDEARRCLTRARELDEVGEIAQRAKTILDALGD